MKFGKHVLHLHSLYYLLLIAASFFFLFYLTIAGAAGIKRIVRALLLIGGGSLLAWGAHSTVKHTIFLLTTHITPSWIIGITLFALSSALPDLLLSGGLYRFGWSDLATYVIIGSNIATVLLVGGIAARMACINDNSRALFQEICIALISTAILGIALFFSYKTNDSLTLSTFHGFLLLLFGIICCAYLFKPAIQGFKAPITASKEKRKHGINLILGLCSVVLGTTSILIVAFESIVHSLIPIHLLGSGFLALCLSLPELALVYFAGKQNQESLALGTVLGSNSINIFRILGILFVLQPISLERGIQRDVLFLFICQILLLFTVKFNKHHALYHLTGMLLMGLYISYLFFLIQK